MVQGYALRTDGNCPAPSYEGGPTWGPWKTCCPPNTYCPPNQYNTVCFQSGTQSTLSQCANSTWNLFVSPVDDEYFCCEVGRTGFISLLNSTYNFFGCATPTEFNSGTMESLSVRVSGTTTPTPSPTSTSTSTTTTATATSTSTSTSTPTSTSSSTTGKSSTNTGAIAGGVVGGVCGLAIIAVLIWLVFRYRSRAAKDQERSVPELDYAGQSNSGYAQTSNVAPSDYQDQGRSPFETPPGSNVSRSGRSELPPDQHSSAASELPAETRVVAHELPSR